MSNQAGANAAWRGSAAGGVRRGGTQGLAWLSPGCHLVGAAHSAGGETTARSRRFRGDLKGASSPSGRFSHR